MPFKGSELSEFLFRCHTPRLFVLIIYVPVNIFSHVGTGLPWLNQYKADDHVPGSRPERSASGDAQTKNPSISSQTLYQ